MRLLLIIVLILMVVVANEIGKKAHKDGIEEYGEEKWQEILEDASNRKIYNDYMFTCPMCGSKKVLKLNTMDRAVSIAVKGLASDKIGKQYQCDHCGHKF